MDDLRSTSHLSTTVHRIPMLSDLPEPPPGRTGWPWTVATPHAPATRPDGGTWPRITVVTPSYRQGAFVEETIRSVLLQGYPNLEYIVLDGGSDDETVDILRRYAPWLSFCRSRPDGGQVRALNEGFARATGHWRSWLNADDFYAPGALQLIGAAPQTEAWLVGRTSYVDAESRRIGEFPLGYRVSPRPQPAWVDVVCAARSGTALPQQSSFWTASAHAAAGSLDESLEYVFEHEFWTRLAFAGFEPTLLDADLTFYRRHPEQKTTGATRAASYREEAAVAGRWHAHSAGEGRRALVSYQRACLRSAWAARCRGLAARAAQRTAVGRARNGALGCT